jgi:hypothetical protein
MTGIGGAVPYGTHLCHFYETRDELAAALVTYFTAGLRGGERCIWITAAPLGADEAEAELRNAGLDVDAAVRQGSLVIRDHSDWYSEGARLKGSAVADLWLEEERRSLAAGYRGLRITGNTSFLTPAGWPEFMDYEALIQRLFADRRIVTLCSYRLPLGAAEVHEVVQRHHCALHGPHQGWQIPR